MSRDELTPHVTGNVLNGDRAFYERPPVRLTDLRLAVDVFRDADGKRGVVVKVLEDIVETVPRPITRQATIRWKRETLNTLAAERDRRQLDPLRKRVRAVTFVAAAICLLLDLGVSSVEHANDFYLRERVVALADEIKKLTKRLNTAAGELHKIAADRSAGNPGRTDFDCLLALSCYRMGYDLKEIADWNGLTRPGVDTDYKGTKNWRKSIAKLLARGVALEKEMYPKAAAILYDGDDPGTAAKADKAYRAYSWALPPFAVASAGEAVNENVFTEEGNELVTAYILLGACRYKGIPPRPHLHT
jgi:hypothetical protein